jgi:eukaryotic-like serine/threonine-protein kinase
MSAISSMVALVGTTVVSRYRIERELGTGGMASVYLAHDIKHDRRVAVKVLRPELSAIVGAERFLNEIRTTANLQHPHILPLHDSGEINGVIFYVMPLVEGESLRDRLNREKQLPIDDAIRIAHDTAEALDYAHRRGVIHRDIKPENILLHDGRALVADFGIALAVSSAGGATRMTETGMSLGTPHYMSPEQAMGEREITARSDVYALGCVLYEMLSGEPPFTGPTAQAITAKVVTSDPAPLITLRRTVPAHVAGAVHQALQRLPADRFGSAREFADAIMGQGTVRFLQAPHKPGAAIEFNPRALLPWVLAAAAAVVAALGWVRSLPPPPPPQVARFEVAGDEALSANQTGTNITLSRDGSQLLYRTRNSGAVIRDLASLEVRELKDIGNNPRFSPDGRSLVYHQQGSVRKLRLAGGGATELVAPGTRPVWGDDGTILYENANALWSVPETGGTPTRVTTPDSSRRERHQWGDFLPGSRAIVFASVDSSLENDELMAVTRHDLKIKSLNIRGTSPHYINGYLVFGRFDGSAAAVPFDVDRLEVTGPELQVIDRLIVRGGGAAELAIAANGTVAYIEGTADDKLVFVDEAGRAQSVTETRGRYIRPRMSPDGSRLVTTIRNSTNSTTDVWMLDVASKSIRRMTTDGQSNHAWWGPGGKSVIWLHVNGKHTEIRSQVLDGQSAVQTIHSSPVTADSGVVTIVVDPSGNWIFAITAVERQRADIQVAATGSRPLAFRPVATTQASEIMPALSPDGRRLAYSSNESGRGEVYVTAFPTPSALMRMSTGGAGDPMWSRDGRTLYYRSPAGMMAARFNSTFTSFTTDTLFSLDRYPRSMVGPLSASYDVAPDGRFVMTQADQARRLVMVLSFADELRQRFAEGSSR